MKNGEKHTGNTAKIQGQYKDIQTIKRIIQGEYKEIHGIYRGNTGEVQGENIRNTRKI